MSSVKNKDIGSNPLDYVTDFGVVCMKRVSKYPKLKEYYDFCSGCIVFPYNNFNSDLKLKEEVANLLFESPFDCDGKYFNWALELLSGDALNEPMVSLRAIEPWG